LNIKLSHKVPLSTFSKLSINSWRPIKDPSTHVKLECDATDVIKAIKQFNKETGSHISLTHYIATILSRCFSKYPELNRVLLRNKVYQRSTVNIFIVAFMKSEDEGSDLAGVSIDGCENKSIQEISSEIEDKVLKLRAGDDKSLKAIRRLINPIPNVFMKAYLKIFEFILYTLNIPLTLLNLPRDSFGSVMITSLGGFGLDTVYAPITPLSRTPFLVCIGKPHLKPWVVDGAVVTRKILTITFTLDHRLIHGVEGAKPYRLFKKLFNSPEELLRKKS
jgi:pyruvate/2-oxoglutarate dehydrogenase complex dihydrolipoamide acyltransferase (E2) component